MELWWGPADGSTPPVFSLRPSIFPTRNFSRAGTWNFRAARARRLIMKEPSMRRAATFTLLPTRSSTTDRSARPQGNVGLAAGSDVLFQQAGNQHLFIQATPNGTTRAVGVTNGGTIQAAAAELKAAGGNAYALAINNTGSIAATGFAKVHGQVYLTADGGNITNSGQISAQKSNGSGGTIVLNGYGTSSSGTVLNSGSLVASGRAAGKNGRNGGGSRQSCRPHGQR